MSETPPRSVPRFFSCLVKGPLGCLAFLVGAAVVVFLFLPPALGRLLDRTLEESFERRHAGSLEVGDAWLGSFYGEQRVERLVLRDPQGDEVLRASLRAPTLEGVLDGPRHRFGPVVLRVELLRLVEDADGSNNLERALAPRLPPPTEGLSSGFSADSPFDIELEIEVERLRFTSAGGREDVLESLVFHGLLALGPETTHLMLEGGSDPSVPEPMRLRLELERPEFGPRRTWSSALALEGAPAALARVLCAAIRPLAAFAGPRIERLEWSHRGEQVVLRCEDEGARFELLGQEGDGLVRGSTEGVLAARLPCSSVRGRSLLGALLPMVQSLECTGSEGAHELVGREFAWPLDGDWSRLAGRIELGLAAVRCLPGPELDLLLGEPVTLESLALEPRPELVARDGTLLYDGFRLAAGQGELRLDGVLELSTGQGDFELRGELEGQPLGPLRFRRPLGRVGGAGGDESAIPELPVAPRAPPPELPVPPRGG